MLHVSLSAGLAPEVYADFNSMWQSGLGNALLALPQHNADKGLQASNGERLSEIASEGEDTCAQQACFQKTTSKKRTKW